MYSLQFYKRGHLLLSEMSSIKKRKPKIRSGYVHTDWRKAGHKKKGYHPEVREDNAVLGNKTTVPHHDTIIKNSSHVSINETRKGKEVVLMTQLVRKISSTWMTLISKM